MKTLAELKEDLGSLNQERASKVDELEALNAKEDFTDEDQKKFENLTEEIENIDKKRKRLKTTIEQREKQEGIESRGVSNSGGVPGGFPVGDTGPTGEQQELGQFRLVKAFREAADQNSQLTGLEREVNQQAVEDARNRGQNLEGNLHIPQSVLFAPSAYNVPMNGRQMSRVVNDLTVDGGTGGDQGGLTVDTELRSLIDILRAKLPFTGEDSLGATFFTDLNGDIEFPRAEEDSNDPGTKTETGSADEQSPTFGNLNLSPTRLPTFTEVTRKLLMQSSVSIEMWVRNYRMYKLAQKMSIDIITHIRNNASNNVVMGDPDGAVATWPKVVEFETLISNDNADEPNMGWLTNAKVRGSWKTIPKESGQATYLWEDDEVNSYMAMVSSLVPDDLDKGATTGSLSSAIFGNWASLYLAQWGGFDFLINPFSRDDEGIIKINAWTFFDQGLRHSEAFAVSDDIMTS
jgi:HK97 family phage major capsid protein